MLGRKGKVRLLRDEALMGGSGAWTREGPAQESANVSECDPY